MQFLQKDSDNLIRLDRLRLATDGSYVNDATVTFTLVDIDGNDVSGATTITMAYIATSNGRYEGVLQSTVTLTEGNRYTIEVTATSGANVRFFKIDAQVKFLNQ